MPNPEISLDVTDYSIDAARRAAATVEGFLKEKEGQLLYELARRSPGPIVEIGSYQGKSTVWLAFGSKAGSGAHIYTVDPHTRGTEAPLRANLARLGLNEDVTMVVESSAVAARDWRLGEIGMLWIDGSHLYDDVALDLREWERFLRPGGIVAIHDTVTFDGPRTVADESVRAFAGYSEIGLCRSITHAIKKSNNSFASASRDRFVYGLRLLRATAWKTIFFVVGTIHPPTRDRRRRMSLS